MPENKFWKCKAVATSNIASLSGNATVDGVSLTAANNDEVLLVGQTDPKENGVYTIGVPWSRTNPPTAGDYPGLHVVITEGTKFANTLWQVTPGAVTFGTTSIKVEQVAAGVHATESAMLSTAAAPARKGIFGQAYDTQLQTVRVTAKDGVSNSVTRWKKALTSELSTGDTTATLNVIKDEIPSTEDRTVFVSRSIGFTGATFTVPENVKLSFIDGGKILIAANQTLTIEGDVEAGLFQIFEYASATTSKVVFGATKKPRLVRPEWWGAKGDGSTNDHTPIDRMFGVPSLLEQELRACFTPGRVYKVDAAGGTIQIGRSTTTPESWIIEGYGATIKGVRTAGTPIFTIGRYVPLPPPFSPIRQQVYKLRWQGLTVTNDDILPPYPVDSAAVALDYAQFCSFRDCTFEGFYSNFVVRNQGGNSNTFENVNIGAGHVGASLGPKLATGGSFNVWRWTGGRIQQCQQAGMEASGTQIQIEGVDFSENYTTGGTAGTALRLLNASEARVTIYTERTSPQTAHNLAKVLVIESSKNVDVIGSRINGATAGGSNDLAAYGIYLQSSSHVRIMNSYFTLHQVADIYCDAACGQGIVIDETNRRDPSVSTLRDYVKVGDATKGRVFNRLRTRDLPRARQAYDASYIGQVSNLLMSPYDFGHASWTKSDAATAIFGTTLAPDGRSLAQVLDFPTVGGGSISGFRTTFATDTQVPLNGMYAILRYWVKPIRVLTQSSPDKHYFRSSLQRFATDEDRFDVDGVYDNNQTMTQPQPPTAESGDWQFVEQVYALPADTPPSNGTTLYRAGFYVSDQGGDGIRVAVWGVQLVVVSDPRAAPPYLPNPAPYVSPGAGITPGRGGAQSPADKLDHDGLLAARIRRRRVDIAAPGLAAAASQTFSLGSQIPAGSRVLGASISVSTAFQVASGTCTLDVGSSADDDAIVVAANVAAAVDGQAASCPPGIAPSKVFTAATQLTATLEASAVNLSTISQGSLTAEVVVEIGQGGSLFEPTELARCTLWLPADPNSRSVASDGTIATWLDASGLGHHFSQSSVSARPLTGLSVSGRPAARFDGLSDLLVGPNMDTLVKPDGASVYALLAVEEVTSDQPMSAWFNNQAVLVNNGGTFGLVLRKTGPKFQAGNYGSAAGGVESASFTVGQPTVVSMRHDGVTMSISVNGDADQTGSAGPTSLSGSGAARLGQGYTTSLYTRMRLVELVIYDRKLSLYEDGLVIQRLNALGRAFVV